MTALLSLEASPLARVLLAALLAATLGCAGAPVAEPAGTAAERLYIEGLEQLREAAYLEAEQTFLKVLKMPAYLTVTATARLRLGDAYFHQQRYESAIEAYRGYVQRHDGSPDVPYAEFMVARSFYEMIPTDFWLLPPVHEMDISAADKARVRIEAFVRRYPLSSHVAQAQKLRDRCVELQLRQHAYVVTFYREREQWLGVVFRLHHTLLAFPARTHTLENYRLLAQGYQQLHWRKRAVAVLEAIVQRWPTDPAAAQARLELGALRDEIARAKAAGDETAEMPKEPPPTASVHPETLGDRRLGEG